MVSSRFVASPSARPGTPLVRARAPLRLGMAGGGTDVSPYCDAYGGMVMNATIALYAYAHVEPNLDGRVRLAATDLRQQEELDAAASLPLEGKLRLHRGVYNRIVSEFCGGKPLAINLTTSVDVPAGSGLGSSSTLVVAMVEAMREYLQLPLGEYDIARLAYQIERIDLGLHGGKQDQYAATFGGFNFMEFYGADRVVVNPLRIKPNVLMELESSILLYFTGVSRESAEIIDAQSQSVKAGDAKAIDAMHALKVEATAMKEALLTGNIASFAATLRRGWEAKKRMAERISNRDIDGLVEAALDSGALAAKISGAGGGGFMMLVCDPVRREDVSRLLAGQPGRVLNCNFTGAGAESWRRH